MQSLINANSKIFCTRPFKFVLKNHVFVVSYASGSLNQAVQVIYRCNECFFSSYIFSTGQRRSDLTFSVPCSGNHFARDKSDSRRLWNPKFNYVILGHVISVISCLTIFDFPATVFTHFHYNIVCAQRHVYYFYIQ